MSKTHTRRRSWKCTDTLAWTKVKQRERKSGDGDHQWTAKRTKSYLYSPNGSSDSENENKEREEALQISTQYLCTSRRFLFRSICLIQVVSFSWLALKGYFRRRIVQHGDRYLSPKRHHRKNTLFQNDELECLTISKPFNELAFSSCLISLNIKSLISFFLHKTVKSPEILFSRVYFSKTSASGTTMATVKL